MGRAASNPGRQLGVRAALATPFLNEGQLLGALSIGSYQDIVRFTHEDAEVLELLGGLATATLVRLEATEQLRELAATDARTGLANRRHATALLQHLFSLARRVGAACSVALLDLDHFKQVNDRHGHAAGDAVLRRLGELLRQSFRAEDVLARWGGEEFLVGLYSSDKADAIGRLSLLLTELSRKWFSGERGATFQVTFSAGVAEYPVDGGDLEQLQRAADVALLRR